jgi:hypothetical protein
LGYFRLERWLAPVAAPQMRDRETAEHGGDGSKAQRGLLDREPEDMSKRNRVPTLTRRLVPRKPAMSPAAIGACAQDANATAASGVATRKLKLSSM